MGEIIILIFDGMVGWIGAKLAECIWNWLHPLVLEAEKQLPQKEYYGNKDLARKELLQKALEICHRPLHRMFIRSLIEKNQEELVAFSHIVG